MAIHRSADLVGLKLNLNPLLAWHDAGDEQWISDRSEANLTRQ